MVKKKLFFSLSALKKKNRNFSLWSSTEREREKKILSVENSKQKKRKVFFFLSLSLFSVEDHGEKKVFFFFSPLENKRDSFCFVSLRWRLTSFFFRVSLCFLKIRRGIEEIFVCFSLSIENSKEKKTVFLSLLKNSKGKKKEFFCFLPVRLQHYGEKNLLFFFVSLLKMTEKKILSLSTLKIRKKNSFLSFS